MCTLARFAAGRGGGWGGRPSIGPFTPSPPLPPPRENLFAQMESFFSFPGVPRCRCIQNKPSTIYPSKPIVPLQQDSGALRTGSGLFVSPAPHSPPRGAAPTHRTSCRRRWPGRSGESRRSCCATPSPAPGPRPPSDRPDITDLSPKKSPKQPPPQQLPTDQR